MNSDEILLANMFIGYFVPASRWPCPFRDLGLDLRAIQRPFTVEFKGKVRSVQPEVVLAADDCEWLVALEIKSRMVTADQVGRYAMLESKEMRRDLALKSAENPTHDLVIMTEHANAESLGRYIARAFGSLGITVNGETMFPIVGREGNCVRIESGSLSRRDVNERLQKGITADCSDSAPSHFLRFTAESPTSTLVPDVVNSIHRQIVRGEDFATREICERIVSYWSVRGSDERNAHINKVQRILSKAVMEDYSGFIGVGNMSAGDPGATIWTVVDKQLNVPRMKALNIARTSFLAKYQDAANDQFRTDQMPLI